MASSTTSASDQPDLAAPFAHDLGFILGVVFRSYVKTANLAVAEIPGGPRGYQIIAAAVHGAVESQSGLAQRLGMDRTVMTYLLDDLEQAGLVVRRPDPADRRNRHVLATERGRELYAEVETKLRLVEDHVLAGLAKDEQETLRALLYRLASRVVATDPVDDACAVVTDLASEAAGAVPRHRARARRGGATP